MDTLDEWISPLTERAITEYLHSSTRDSNEVLGGDSTLEFENDGSNLRFRDSAVQKAQIVKWFPEPRPTQAILADSSVTVRAVFSQSSVRAYEKSSGDGLSIRQKTKGCYIQLLDFQIVFEHSRGVPDVHLYIEHFTIDKSKRDDCLSGTQQVLEKANVSHLMKTVLKYVKNINPSTKDLEEPDAYQSDGSIKSQPDIPPPSSKTQSDMLNVDSQEVFATQVAPVLRSGFSEAIPALGRGGRALGNELLGYLGSRARPSSNELPSQRSVSQNTPRSGRHAGVSDRAWEEIASNKTSPPLDNGGPTSERDTNKQDQHMPIAAQGPQISRHSSAERQVTDAYTARSSAPPNGNHTVSTPSPLALPKLGRKRKTDGLAPEEIPDKQDGRNESLPNESSPKRRKHLHLPTESESDPPDPWKGMTKIRRRDVRVRKDQNKLLENSPCWVPPQPGAQMPQCHVPPSLLKRWNETISRKISLPMEVDSQRGSLARVESLPPVIPSSALLSESESEEELLPWSSSPPDHQRHNPLVPADSSPAQRNDLIRRPAGPHEKRDDDQAHGVFQPPQDNDPKGAGEAAGAAVLEHSNNTRDNVTLSTKEQKRLNDESDDSDMDISVPRPLQSGSQQYEPLYEISNEATSSGPNLPRLKSMEKVQVVETPALDLERLRTRRLNGGIMYQEPRSQQEWSQTTKSSSESRIINTYDSNGHTVRDGPSVETQHSPVHYSVPSIMTQKDDDITMQDRKYPSLNCESMPNSQPFSDLSLYSQRNDFETSGQAACMVEPEAAVRSQNQEATTKPKSTEKVGHSLSHQSDGNHLKDDHLISPLKRSRDKMPLDQASSPKRRASSKSGETGTAQVAHEAAISTMVTRRQSYITKGAYLAKAQEIHDKFRRDYPIYSGDFTHFTRMCAKLEALRARGEMQRSFLWDDFVIRHLQDYPHYLEQCVPAAEEPLRYEDYFIYNFLKPTFKKRSLTATAVEVSAAHCTPATGTTPCIGSSIVQAEINRSFTGSLVNKLSKLRTFSFQSTPEKDILNVPHVPARASSSVQEQIDDAVVSQSERPKELQDTFVESDNKLKSSPHERHDEGNATTSELTETDDDGISHEHHDTASIELGDEDYMPGPEIEMEVESEVEPTTSFLWSSAPPGPCWSDSPNTPFKSWATAHENVKSDRHRRGVLPTDGNGVIQAPVYPQKVWERWRRTLGSELGSKDDS